MCILRLDPDEDDELREFEELQRKESSKEQLTLMERGKLMVEHIVQKIGFFGILACASVSNILTFVISSYTKF